MTEAKKTEVKKDFKSSDLIKVKNLGQRAITGVSGKKTVAIAPGKEGSITFAEYQAYSASGRVEKV